MKDWRDRLVEAERLVRCSLRTFDKFLNTTETRIIKRAAKRIGITYEPNQNDPRTR